MATNPGALAVLLMVVSVGAAAEEAESSAPRHHHHHHHHHHSSDAKAAPPRSARADARAERHAEAQPEPEPAPLIIAARVGWADAAPGAWNSAEAIVGDIRRIPLDGLRTINQDKDNDPRYEDADGRAVVLVPRALDPRRPVDILFHLHGYYPGCRQERGAAHDAPLRDRDVDHMEEQLEQSGRHQLIIVLPQGAGYAVFAPAGSHASNKGFDTTALAEEILARLASAQLVPTQPELHRVLLSAHSGGGDALGQILLTAQMAPRQLSLVAFFDAINGPREELPRVEHWLEGRLLGDLTQLRKRVPSEQRRYLREALRFRAYYSQSSYYTPLHDDPEAHIGEGLRPLRQFLDEWFSAHAAELGGAESEVFRGLRGNYQVQRARDAGHDTLLGAGTLHDALSALPPESGDDADSLSNLDDLEPLRG